MVGNSCPVIRRDGQPCQGAPGPSGMCWSHDPSVEERRREGRKRGGHGKSRKARAEKLMPEDLQIMDGLLANAIAEVYRGNSRPAKAPLCCPGWGQSPVKGNRFTAGGTRCPERKFQHCGRR